MCSEEILPIEHICLHVLTQVDASMDYAEWPLEIHASICYILSL